MTKIRRKLSESQIYHIIFKGIDNQNLFYDDQDREFFLKQISKTKKEFNYVVYAYCLMVNHVHMVIRAENEILSKAMQSLMIRYVRYFNSRYMRTGTLIQGRFNSKSVEDQEYLGKEKIINKKILLYYFNNDISEFIKYTTKASDMDNLEDYVEYEMIGKLTDEQLSQIIMKKFDIGDISDIAMFFKNRSKEELKKDIKIIKNINGTYKTQVSRVIRINRKLVGKFWDS